jgi:hypothetical protein
MRRGVRLAGLPLLLLAGQAVAQMPPPTISPDIPNDVAIPAGFAGDPTVFFDDFSWRSFVALSWPAVSGQRGVADAARPVGDLSGPRVWDTWKADYELFQDRASPPPSDWSSFDAIAPCPGVTDNRRKILAAFSKIGGFNQAGFGVDAGPLVARNRTYVRYEVRFNEPEFRTIFDNQYYLRDKLPTDSAPADFHDGSIEVKAAWRELKSDEPAETKARYHTVKALVFDPLSDRCHEKEMGLVGLHIVSKTPSRPQWIWSSFEHVDNLPEPGSPPDAQGWAFNDGDPAQQQLKPISRPPLGPANPPQADPDPNQVIRLRPILASTMATNAAYETALAGTVWANYRLVMTQWPTADLTSPAPAKDGKPFPANNAVSNLANATMETYLQKTSCMTCHQTANKRGFDFVWFMSLRAFPPPQPEAGPAAAMAARATPDPVAINRMDALDELRALVRASQAP